MSSLHLEASTSLYLSISSIIKFIISFARESGLQNLFELTYLRQEGHYLFSLISSWMHLEQNLWRHDLTQMGSLTMLKQIGHLKMSLNV